MSIMTTLGRLTSILSMRRTAPEQVSSRDRVVSMGGRVAGVFMNADEALRLSVVWACVTIIAKSIAASEWDVFVEDPNGNRASQKSTTTWKLLNLRPNDEMIPFAFREAMLIQALVYGNAFAEIERDGMGRAVALWPIVADRAILERDRATGRLVLRVMNGDRGETILPYADVYHLHGPSLDGVAGFDMVAIAARALAHSAAAERFGAAFYGNGTTFGGVLEDTGDTSVEKLDFIREQIEQRHRGPDRAFKFLILTGGMKWASTSTTPEEAQFVESRQFMVAEVCRYFGVPPHKVQHLINATFSNIEHQGLEFSRDALTPWCERMRQEADWKLVPGSGRFLRTRINIDWLSEGDAKSRAETDGVLVTAGIKTRNEARKDRGLNTLGPDGDVPTVNPGTTALPIALKPPEPKPIPAAPAPTEPPADPAPAEQPA